MNEAHDARQGAERTSMNVDPEQTDPGQLRLQPDDRWPGFASGFGEVLATPNDALHRLNGDIETAGGLVQIDPDRAGAIGFTMFDSPQSEDNSVTVLLADGHIVDVPSQSLVRIKSKDGRRYLGTVVAGPFAEPDGLR